MTPPRIVTFHGLRPSASVDALSEVWLERLAERALLSCRVEVHEGSHVGLELGLPEGWIQLACPCSRAAGRDGAIEAVHACFLSAERILGDRSELLDRTRTRPLTLVAAVSPSQTAA